ncbi:MAG: hypothetical protein ABR502_00945 [Chitinophagaceae bacterium]
MKGAGDKNTGLPEAYMYNTGSKGWQSFYSWPPADADKKRFYLQKEEKLFTNAPSTISYSEYVSDPKKPVPYTMDIGGSFGITPKKLHG